MVGRYAERALTHGLGRPDEVVITLEALEVKPEEIPALRVTTLQNEEPRRGRQMAERLLAGCGIGTQGMRTAWNFIGRRHGLRGGILLDTEGVRLDPNLERGVRVSRMGISRRAERDLSRMLAAFDWDHQTVREALVLASKVHAHPKVVAELCVSDDPDYTTGYVASRRLGYVRIPHLKKEGSRRGGRAFFIGVTDVPGVLEYLERTPVIVTSLKGCLGLLTEDAIPDLFTEG